MVESWDNHSEFLQIICIVNFRDQNFVGWYEFGKSETCQTTVQRHIVTILSKLHAKRYAKRTHILSTRHAN